MEFADSADEQREKLVESVPGASEMMYLMEGPGELLMPQMTTTEPAQPAELVELVVVAVAMLWFEAAGSWDVEGGNPAVDWPS